MKLTTVNYTQCTVLTLCVKDGHHKKRFLQHTRASAKCYLRSRNCVRSGHRRPCWIPFSWMTLPSSSVLRTTAADPRSDGRHSGPRGRQAGARVKVVPSLGSVLPAPAARSTPATVADPDHLQLPPAELDHVRSPIPFSWMTLPSSSVLRIPRRRSTLRRPSQRPTRPAGRRQGEGGPFPRLDPSSPGSTIHAGHRRRS